MRTWSYERWLNSESGAAGHDGGSSRMARATFCDASFQVLALCQWMLGLSLCTYHTCGAGVRYSHPECVLASAGAQGVATHKHVAINVASASATALATPHQRTAITRALVPKVC